MSRSRTVLLAVLGLAGSFVAFLVSQFGEAAFRTAFRRLRSSEDAIQIAENERIFRELFGLDLDQAERSWRDHLGRPLPRRTSSLH